MKEKFEKVKKYVNNHQDEIIAAGIGSILTVCSYVIGLYLGKLYGFQDGVLTCNKAWMDFVEKCTPKED